jgi:hypothetical protein
MTLGESYLRGILRPPPVSAEALPPNPSHPFQQSFAYYLRTRLLKHHFPLLVGFGFSVYVFNGVSGAMQQAKVNSYEKAIKEGRVPCELPLPGDSGSARRAAAGGMLLSMPKPSAPAHAAAGGSDLTGCAARRCRGPRPPLSERAEEAGARARRRGM